MRVRWTDGKRPLVGLPRHLSMVAQSQSRQDARRIQEPVRQLQHQASDSKGGAEATFRVPYIRLSASACGRSMLSSVCDRLEAAGCQALAGGTHSDIQTTFTCIDIH